MKKIVFNNKTKYNLIIKYVDRYYEIFPNEKKTIEIGECINFHIFKKHKPSSKFYIGQYFSRETTRNIWILGPVIMINLDSTIEVSNNINQINITEKKYHFLLFSIFSILLFNDKLSQSYAYHKNSDICKLKSLSLLYLFPIAILILLLTTSFLLGVIYDFSFDNFLLFILCSILIIFFIKLARSIHNIIRLNKKDFADLKQIYITKEKDWLLRYKE